MKRLSFPAHWNRQSMVSRAGLAAAVITLGSLGSVVAAASVSAGTSRVHSDAAHSAKRSTDSSTENPPLSLVESVHLDGGYAAAGVAMRNLGYGTIHLSGIQDGSTVEDAYLIWNVIDSSHATTRTLALGMLDTSPITGTQRGKSGSACWPRYSKDAGHSTYSYIATVTDLVNGNGTYRLSGFDSGTTNGQTPTSGKTGSASPFPELEGATLVVVYENPSTPLTDVQLYEGAAESNSGNILDETLTTFTAANSSPVASTTFIVADGQGAGSSGSFNGTTLVTPFLGATHLGTGPNTAPGYAGGDLWDTETFKDVSVNPLATSATAAVVGTRDCVTWAGQVFSVTTSAATTASPPPIPPPPGPLVTRVFGPTADATAAAEFVRTFPYTKGSCPASRTALIATTATYQDALSSQFLAQSLTTGTLLTPTKSLSPVTEATLKEEGISTVYIVGGPLAITPTVATAIGNLTAYECGGTNPKGKIAVQRVYGQTAYGTAEAIVNHVGTAPSMAFAGAYSTTNATDGTGHDNDTAGKGSAAPAGPQLTAILASGQEFQDAQAASMISYHTAVPLLLTPAATLSATAVAAIEKLGIKQVILMGGQLAVTNSVETALAAQTGAAVLRVAGKDYTDTARELARFEAAGSPTGLGWTPGHRIMVARGNGFTDGIAGAVLENKHNATTGASTTARPLLLTESPTAVGAYLTTFLKTTGHTGIDKTTGKTITALTLLGGTLAVSPALVTVMDTAMSH